MRTSSFIPCLFALMGATAPAAAQSTFAEPPPGREPLTVADPGPEPYPEQPDDGFWHHPESTVRVHVGPVLRIAEPGTDGGLGASLDIGSRAAGARIGGAWVQVGSDGGLAQYTAELWLDFGFGRPLHPILAAGAGVARSEMTDPVNGGLAHATVGVGTLRGSLQYLLPVRHTDARASLDVMGAVPAVRGSSDGDMKPYVMIGASVGVGF